MLIVLQPGEVLEVAFAVGPDTLTNELQIQFSANESDVSVVADCISDPDSDGSLPRFYVRDTEDQNAMEVAALKRKQQEVTVPPRSDKWCGPQE